MTREQNIVITGYLFLCAMFSGFTVTAVMANRSFFAGMFTFLAVGFGLGYVLKIVNSIPQGHTHGLEAAPLMVTIRPRTGVSDVIESHGTSGRS